MEPSVTAVSLPLRMSGTSSRTSTIRTRDALDMTSMTKIMEIIIRLMRIWVT